MDRGLESAPQTTPIHVVVVGDSDWLRETADVLERSNRFSVDGPDDSESVTLTVPPGACVLRETDVQALGTSETACTDDSAPSAVELFPVGAGDNGAAEIDDESDRMAIDESFVPPIRWFVAQDTTDGRAVLRGQIERAIETALETPLLGREKTSRAGRIEALLGSGQFVSVTVDGSGRILEAGPAAPSAFDVDRNALIDSQLVTFLHPNDRAIVDHALQTVDRDRGIVTVDGCRIQRGDTWRFVQITSATRNDGQYGPPRIEESSDDEPGDVGDDRPIQVVIESLDGRAIASSGADAHLERVTDGFIALDDRMRFTYVNPEAGKILDVDPDAALGTPFLELFPEASGTAFERAALDAVAQQRPQMADAYYEPLDAWIEARCYPSESGLSIYFSDVTDREQYQRALSALHEAVQGFLVVDSSDDAFEKIVEVGHEIVHLPTLVVYRFEPTAGELVPVAHTSTTVGVDGPIGALSVSDSTAGKALLAGETIVPDDVDDLEGVHRRDSMLRSALYVPLGDHGVLVAESGDPEAFDDRAVELAQLLAGTAEATLDRLEGSSELESRERILERRTEELERIDAAESLRRDVMTMLLHATDRGEIEQGVCERLVAEESIPFAWIAEPDPGGNVLLPRVTVGDDGGYVDAVEITAVDDPDGEPTGRTAVTREATIVDTVADSLRDASWRSAALSRELQSALSVPIVYDDYLYGVLTMYADRPGYFDDAIRSRIEPLGSLLGYAIQAMQRRPSTLDNGGATIELQIETADVIVTRLSAAIDRPVSFEGAARQSDDTRVLYVTTDVPVDESNLSDDLVDTRLIESSDEYSLLQIRVDQPCLASVVESHGGTLREATATESSLSAVIDVPGTVEIRDLVTAVGRTIGPVELIAKRERDPEDTANLGTNPRTLFLSGLTDRQREVVLAAYHGGYFETPRRMSGTEIAESLDISAPAFHNHLRTVHRQIFEYLFEPDGSSGVNQ